MTKDEIFEKLQTEVTIRGLSPGTYYTYKRAIDLFLIWSDKPYEQVCQTAFRHCTSRSLSRSGRILRRPDRRKIYPPPLDSSRSLRRNL